MREQRRGEITHAFARVLAERGFARATIAAVAAEAGIAPGLVHHHFDSKDELLSVLLEQLVAGFRQRVAGREGDPLLAYGDGALALDASADVVAARCWVGLFAEAIRNPTLFRRVRRLLDGEVQALQRRSGHALSNQDAAALLAFVVGALVVGAFAPRKTAGFAAPAFRRFAAALCPPSGEP